MKKVIMMAALVLGTTAMVNAQTAPAQTAPAKEVKHAKHVKKQAEKAEMKVEKTVAPTKAAAPAKK